MGKGDKKTKRGKIIMGSYGVRRPKVKSRKHIEAVETPVKKEKKKEETAKVVDSNEATIAVAEKKIEKKTEKKTEKKKTVTKKPTAKKAAPDKTEKSENKESQEDNKE